MPMTDAPIATTPQVQTQRARIGSIRLLHSPADVSRIVGARAMSAIFPTSAGIMMYGWRAVAAIGVVVISSMAALGIWRRIGVRGAHLRIDHTIWIALMLALTLPAHLMSGSDLSHGGVWLWPMLAASGVCAVICTWYFGGIGAERVHPVVVTHLLLFVCFSELLVPHLVLQRQRAMSGDLFHVAPQQVQPAAAQPWIRSKFVPGFDSIRVAPAAQTLLAYTTSAKSPTRAWMSLESFLRDRMPPMEDLVVGGHPGPIGTGSTIAVIIGGLFLLYRGLIDYRVPLLIVLSAAITMLILPIPVLVRDDGTLWRWIAFRSPEVGWPAALTLVNYELVAGPLVFVAFFLATSPAVRPLVRRRRLGYAVLLGVLAGVLQLYISVAIGAYVALLAASLITRTLDRTFHAKTIV